MADEWRHSRQQVAPSYWLTQPDNDDDTATEMQNDYSIASTVQIQPLKHSPSLSTIETVSVGHTENSPPAPLSPASSMPHCPLAQDKWSLTKLKIAASITGRRFEVKPVEDAALQKLHKDNGERFIWKDENGNDHVILGLGTGTCAPDTNTIVKALITNSPFFPKELDGYSKNENLLRWAADVRLAERVAMPPALRSNGQNVAYDEAINFLEESLSKTEKLSAPPPPPSLIQGTLSNICLNSVIICICCNCFNFQRPSARPNTISDGPSPQFLGGTTAPGVADLLICVDLIPDYGFIRKSGRWPRVTKWMAKMLREPVGYESEQSSILCAAFPSRNVTIFSILDAADQKEILDAEAGINYTAL